MGLGKAYHTANRHFLCTLFIKKQFLCNLMRQTLRLTDKETYKTYIT